MERSKVAEDCYRTLFSGHDSGVAHTISQGPWLCAQDLCMIKAGKLTAWMEEGLEQPHLEELYGC